MAQSLFAPVAQAKDSLIEFKAGGMREDAQKWVRPDERKGLVQLKRGADDGLIHFIWKDRTSGATELDLIIFPDEAVFRKVEEAKPEARVFLLQFKTGTKRHFFWMQEPKADKDEEIVAKVNQIMNNPSDEGSEAEGGMNNQLLMQMLGGAMPPRRQQAAPTSQSAPAASPATQPASTSTPAAAPAAPAAAVPAAQAAAPDAMRQQLSSMLQGMLPALQQQQEQERVSLNDVLATDALLKTGILSDPAVRAELEQHLPSIDQGRDLATTLRSPQFRQCVESFNAALNSGSLPELLASFGLPPSSEPSASNLEAFLKAVQAKADKEKKDAEKK